MDKLNFIIPKSQSYNQSAAEEEKDTSYFHESQHNKELFASKRAK